MKGTQNLDGLHASLLFPLCPCFQQPSYSACTRSLSGFAGLFSYRANGFSLGFETRLMSRGKPFLAIASVLRVWIAVAEKSLSNSHCLTHISLCVAAVVTRNVTKLVDPVAKEEGREYPAL